MILQVGKHLLLEKGEKTKKISVEGIVKVDNNNFRIINSNISVLIGT